MLIEQPPEFIRRFWPAVWRIPQSTPTVYLTFDDGPNPIYTPQVLAILKKYAIKATFFCVGDNVRKYPNILQSVLSDGHDVGNHTMHHLKGFEKSLQSYLDDVSLAESYIQSAHFFRPPHGQITFKQARALSERYQLVMWDVVTRDYNQRLRPEQIIRKVKYYTRNGSIITFHDSEKASKNMLMALEPSIKWLLAQGYEFKLLSDVL